MKKVTENIILIEPNRFSSEDIDILLSDLKISKSSSKIKSNKISKVWIWKDTGEIICWKEKGNPNIKYDKIDLNIENIETFRLNDEIKKQNDTLEVDIILDKISKNGIESLTKKEKEFLQSHR